MSFPRPPSVASPSASVSEKRPIGLTPPRAFCNPQSPKLPIRRPHKFFNLLGLKGLDCAMQIGCQEIPAERGEISAVQSRCRKLARHSQLQRKSAAPPPACDCPRARAHARADAEPCRKSRPWANLWSEHRWQPNHMVMLTHSLLWYE